MMHDIELQYFFDPLCGWCYASAPALAGLAAKYPDQLRMMPSGLAVEGRPISTIADHAWRNDQRIGALTGQPFSDAYHHNVLRAPDGRFDSGPATLALTVLGEIDRNLEAPFMHAAQIARYVQGRDTARIAEVAEIAVQVASRFGHALIVNAFADRLQNDTALQALAQARIADTQARMDALQIRGVPQLVVVRDGNPSVLGGEVLYHGADRLLEAITALPAIA